MLLRWLLATALTATAVTLAFAQDGTPGITTPTVFATFDPNAPACEAPPDLKSELVFAQDNERDFMLGVSIGLAMAAENRGLSYRALSADNDAGKQDEDVQALLAETIGAVVAAPVDAAALAGRLEEIIWTGAYVGTVVPPPATSLLNAPQYLTGKVLGDAAAAYIAEHLGGEANVVLLTHDSLQFLAPRFAAMRDSLSALPGVTIVADLSPRTVNEEGGYATMNLILIAEPDIDVVLGADTVVLGALAALRDAGKRPA